MKLTNKVLGLSLAAAVGFASVSMADDARGTGKKSLESRIAELEAKLKDAGAGGVKGSGIKISGYVDTSYIVNLSDRDNVGPVAGSSNRNTGRVFDNEYDSFNVNAVKLTIEKGKDTSKFPAGFRVDTIVGEDANVLDGSRTANGAGNNDSKLFLEQAYINLGVPLGNGIDVKFGKMVSLVGYEVIESPANWQFSRSDAFRLAPSTQTGATFGYQWNDYLTSTVGVINGVDNATVNTGAAAGAGNLNTSLGFVGRIDLTAPKNDVGEFSAFLAGLLSNDDVTATASNDRSISIINLGGMLNKPFGIAPLGLGVDLFHRHDDRAVASVDPLANGAIGAALNSSASVEAYVAAGYAKWDWNKWLTTSGRFSYSGYHNPRTVPVGLASSLGPLVVPNAGSQPTFTDMYTFTLTQAFNIWKDTLIRLEWRRDWTDTPAVGFGAASAGATSRDDIRQEQDTIAVNLVYSF